MATALNFTDSFSSISNMSLKSNLKGVKASRKKLAYSAQLGKNISKVKWITTGQTFSIPDQSATEHFIMGSWAEDKNEVSLWEFSTDESGDGNTVMLHKEQIRGDVSGLCCIDGDNFALTTSLGELMTFKLMERRGEGNEDADPNSQPVAFNLSANLKLHFARKDVPGPATGIAANSNSIVTVGEDGSIFEVSPLSMKVVRNLLQVEPLSITCVAFTGRSEIVTGNSSGQLKLWDLRSYSQDPIYVMTPNSPINCISGAASVAQHPSQSRIILVGYNDGAMDLWDARNDGWTEPIAKIPSSGFGAISELAFHEINSDIFFTCSQSGEISQWFPSNDFPEVSQNQSEIDLDLDLNIEFLQKGLDFKSIYRSTLPCNSMSISQHSRILCGGDSGVIHCSEIRV